MQYKPDVAGRKKTDDRRYWIGREEVAARLGVSVPTVRRLEARKELHAVRGAHGAHLYDPNEVAALAARWASAQQGAMAAQAFRIFDEGKGWRQVMVQLKLAPADARYLWAEWNTPPGAPAPGRPPTAAEEQAEEDRLRAESDRAMEDWEAQMREQQRALEEEWRRDDRELQRRRAVEYHERLRRRSGR